ncbi:ephrin type-B receptor [Rhynchospora pubera]|uniref:Ephrin type-B receptor n=1 Tax=Rhynchospora pubera TaxID=906938 RepID=A0AAV8DDI9_9POAL|nr:ephrin type-B receptor [Rhynchospora pubera]
MAISLLSFLLFLLLTLRNPNSSLAFPTDQEADFSILTWHDYSPPSPPPPPPSPTPPYASCEHDLGGSGDFDTLCEVLSSKELSSHIYIQGTGSLVLLAGVSLTCPKPGCEILANLTGHIKIGANSKIVAGRVVLASTNISLLEGTVVDTTGLAGDPPPRTSGSPTGTHGDGGGFGGRGASCYVRDGQTQEDSWGGDPYDWTSLQKPDSYGSRGGSTSVEADYGGGGGGRVWIMAKEVLELEGMVMADGGGGGDKGGGGSGGSIYVVADKMKGSGNISASGGSGLAGGGGGRVSVDVFSRHDDTMVSVHGGKSSGCPDNYGAAGTLYDAVPKSLIVDNNNYTTQTDTLLMEFPYQPLWTNVFVRNCAKAAVPLRWSRVQVQGTLSILSGAVLTFGLTRYPYSEFELLAEELLMSDSTVKVFGGLRMSVKMLLMWNARMMIDGGDEPILATSLLEASNLIVLKEASVIHSNANLGVHGQGLLNLSGSGDTIEAQRLILSLFYSIQVGPGSVLRGPIINGTKDHMAPKLNCESETCPAELIHPPEDCNVNTSLSFTLQICRVEDIDVSGLIEGTVVHFHRARSITVYSSGIISATGRGCRGGIGRGKVISNGLGGGGGHGGKGGDGFFDGTKVDGGVSYGSSDLPCELGSGSGNDILATSTAGGGIIVMGSWEHSLMSLSVYGSVESDGESVRGVIANSSTGGPGGGSGGTILLFLRTLTLGEASVLSTAGGIGSRYGGGGGGGGRIHFHWSDITTGDEYVPVASVNGLISSSGGVSKGPGYAGDNGTVTGQACPKGLYGTFCKECPLGTYKNETGSGKSLCRPCPSNELPRRAIFVSIRGGVAETPCPYKCVSDRYHMPHCYTALEELIYTFGGPWLFGLFLTGLLVLLALVLSVARMKFVGNEELPGPAPTQHGSQIDHSFPFLESLNEVLETNRQEESQSHVHRVYFMGPNTFSEPWHLPHCPPDQIAEIVYEDAYNRFVDEINALAAYQWWEGAVYSIVGLAAYPLAWSWQQWRRRKKLQRLREFVRSEYDHSCLRSCRSRALYEGLKVAATPEYMLGYVDFFLGGDEKRADLPPRLHQRFPMSILFGGDGSYMAPFNLHSDNVLTSLMGQAIQPTIWYRLVAGLNAQLRLVRRGCLRSTLAPVLNWLETHANPALSHRGVQVDLAWFQATALGYCQLGLVIYAVEGGTLRSPQSDGTVSRPPRNDRSAGDRPALGDALFSRNRDAIVRKKITGGVIDSGSLRTLKEKRDFFFPFSLILHNTKPVGHQDLVGLVISMLLLADFSLVLLTFLQLYSFSMVDILLVLFILPLGILSPFPAGINALFSHGPRRSAGLARVYALWNITSLVNVVVAFLCGLVHYKSSNKKHPSLQPWSLGTDESGWWLFPAGLVLCKCIQARLVDWHVANLEIQDRSLYSPDPNDFWQT